VAWDTTLGTAGTVVAVLDTGIAAGHQDLAGGLTGGWDFVNGDSNPADDHGHGTSTAGVAAARTNNGLGIAGACGACSIMPVKVADGAGYAFWSNLASGITWATDHGARVISMSIAGTSGGTTLSNAVQYAHDRGVVLVAAAGNAGNTTLQYPSAFGPVVSVAGSDSSDNRYGWSTYGSWVDVAAPGCNQATTSSGGYSNFCGTSSATPLVAGVAAILASARPSASNTAIETALSSTAVPVSGSWVRDGRIDAGAAVSALLGGAAPPPDPPPAPTPTTVTETFSASLTNKISTRTFTFTSGAGASDLSLSFTKASALTLSVKDATKATVANLSGPSVLRVTTAPGASGTWTVVVSGSTRASFTLTVRHPAA
jgi:subtilisin family serine protease